MKIIEDNDPNNTNQFLKFFKSKQVQDLLKKRYKNPNSLWAMRFARELYIYGAASRNIRSVRMRTNKVLITVYFQAKIGLDHKIYYRFITGTGWPPYHTNLGWEEP